MNGYQGKKYAAVFLDRDGTLNAERNYLYRIEDWEWLPGVPESLGSLARAGFKLVVVTNQSGIARGYYTETDVIKLHEWVDDDLYRRTGVRFDGFYICPHHPAYGAKCTCRKPDPGMLQSAAEDLNIELTRSWMIGDKLSDVQAGQAAGCRSLLVLTGYGEQVQRESGSGIVSVARSFADAAQYIIEHQQTAD